MQELETQAMLSCDFGYLTEGMRDEIVALIAEVARLINGLIRSLSHRSG